MTLPSRTLTLAIRRPAEDVYAFVSNPENLPRWSFIEAVSRRGDTWFAKTPDGEVTIRFVAPNDLGVLDHFIRVAPDADEIYVPMRVIRNGAGSEVQFTLFRLASMSDDELERDANTVEEDLARLKQLLEASS